MNQDKLFNDMKYGRNSCEEERDENDLKILLIMPHDAIAWEWRIPYH